MLKTLAFSTLAIALAVTTAPLHAQASSHGEDLTHAVHYDLGDTHFLAGDSITIDSITGTGDTVTPGNLYQVKGHYRLRSHPTAELALNITGKDHNVGPSQGMRLQHVDVAQGEGAFTVYMYLWGEGYPHLSFYPTGGGSSFSALYFGNGPTLMQPHEATHDAYTTGQ